MVRLTWRQLRTPALIVLGLLAVVAVVLAVTGPGLVHLYDTTVTPCGRYGDCPAATVALLGDHSLLRVLLDAAVEVAPALLGAFWGAPLVARELETGTWRLAWSQSVTRARWLAVKLGLVSLGAMVSAGLLSLMVTWWSSPVDRVNAGLFVAFDQRDLVPVGYAAFALVLGVAAGLVIRRTLPAMATALAVFVTARLTVARWLRPVLIPPVHRTYLLTPGLVTGFGLTPSGPNLAVSPPVVDNAWVISTGIVNRGGQSLTSQQLQQACPRLVQGLAHPPGSSGGPVTVPGQVSSSLQACVAKLAPRYHVLTTYQPADHYWPLQWAETGLFVTAALLLAGFCLWWVRRRP